MVRECGCHSLSQRHIAASRSSDMEPSYHVQRGVTAGEPDDHLRVEVDVKVKLKLVASGKWILALLTDASAAGNASVAGYLRALIMHA